MYSALCNVSFWLGLSTNKSKNQLSAKSTEEKAAMRRTKISVTFSHKMLFSGLTFSDPTSQKFSHETSVQLL